jgi:hypothetical protein
VLGLPSAPRPFGRAFGARSGDGAGVSEVGRKGKGEWTDLSPVVTNRPVCAKEAA